MDTRNAQNSEEWFVLKGNIAPDGMLMRASGLPETLCGFRGIVRLFTAIEEAIQCLNRGEIAPGTAVVFLPTVHAWTSESLWAYEQALEPVRNAVCTIFCGEQMPLVACCGAYLCPKQPTPYLDHLREGDVLEYDVAARTINVDLTPEGFRHRISSQADVPYVIEEIQSNTWSILDRYSRMFLVAGTEKALLIDTGFGTTDVRDVISSLTDLPYEVILTHGHWDHVGGMRYFPDAWIHESDIPLAEEALKNVPHSCRFHKLEHEHIFDLGDRTLKVLHCPGHTCGSIVILDAGNKALFSGDAVAEGPTYLFMEHCSITHYIKSMHMLERYKEQIDNVFPSHRSPVLDAEYISEIACCAEKILNGSLQGEGTCIAKFGTCYNTYRFGRCAIYYN